MAATGSAKERRPGLRCGSYRRPDRLHHALHRRLDHPLPAHHARGHAVSKAVRASETRPLPPHAGLVRLLLRHATSDDLGVARQVLRCAGDAERRREAALHHHGDDRLRADASVSDYFDSRMGAAPGLRALADAAPTGLLQRARGRDPLLLAGEIRRAAAVAIRRNIDGPDAISGRGLASKLAPAATREVYQSDYGVPSRLVLSEPLRTSNMPGSDWFTVLVASSMMIFQVSELFVMGSIGTWRRYPSLTRSLR